MKFNVRLQRVLNPGDIVTMYRSAYEDWQRDSRGLTAMTFADFTVSVLELATIWASEHDQDSFVSLFGYVTEAVVPLVTRGAARLAETEHRLRTAAMSLPKVWRPWHSLNPKLQAKEISRLSPQQLYEELMSLDPEERAAVMLFLEPEVRAMLLLRMPASDFETIFRLFDDKGRLETMHFFSLSDKVMALRVLSRLGIDARLRILRQLNPGDRAMVVSRMPWWLRAMLLTKMLPEERSSLDWFIEQASQWRDWNAHERASHLKGLPIDRQVGLISSLTPEERARVLKEMHVVDAVELLRAMPKRARKLTFKAMSRPSPLSRLTLSSLSLTSSRQGPQSSNARFDADQRGV